MTRELHDLYQRMREEGAIREDAITLWVLPRYLRDPGKVRLAAIAPHGSPFIALVEWRDIGAGYWAHLSGVRIDPQPYAVALPVTMPEPAQFIEKGRA